MANIDVIGAGGHKVCPYNFQAAMPSNPGLRPGLWTDRQPMRTGHVKAAKHAQSPFGSLNSKGRQTVNSPG